MFGDPALFALFEGMRVNAAILTPPSPPWLLDLHLRSFLAYQLTVGGLAPAAARYAGFSANRTVWVSLVLSGLTAGLAGVGEVVGPVGQLNLNISPGLRLRRHHRGLPGAAQRRGHRAGRPADGPALPGRRGRAGGPAATRRHHRAGFQGMLLFFLLGADVFVDYRLKPRPWPAYMRAPGTTCPRTRHHTMGLKPP
jgi:simple sugar transport system permease protein